MSEPNEAKPERREWEILGPRLTVYNLIHEFLDPTWTEARIAEAYRITTEQVATARAYVFANFESVMARHYEIERERTEAVAAQPRLPSSKARFERFARWVHARKASSEPDLFPTFQEWEAGEVPQAELIG